MKKSKGIKMKAILIVISLFFSGCAITWSGVALATATGVLVAEDIGNIARHYKDTKDYFNEDSKEDNITKVEKVYPKIIMPKEWE